MTWQKPVCAFFANLLRHERGGKNRLPEILIVITDGKLEARRHHANDCRLSAEVDLTADDVWITGITSLPESHD